MENPHDKFGSTLSKERSEGIKLVSFTVGLWCLGMFTLSSCTVSTGSTSSGTGSPDANSSAAGSPTVTDPNGPDRSWKFGSTYHIKWNVGDLNTNVKIELLKSDKPYLVIAEAYYNGGEYTWTIPDTVASGTDYKVKITGVNESDKTDESDNNFSITSTGE